MGKLGKISKMIIRLKRSKSLRGSSPKAPHNKERLKWIADSKEGRTLDEIKKHNKRTDAWILLNKKVYNVTSWIV